MAVCATALSALALLALDAGPAAARPAAARTAKPAAARTAKPAAARTARTAGSGQPPLKHVWVIVEENKDGLEWELLGQRYAPYLADTLVSDGALLSNYYGTGHASADNYISMVSGQPPTWDSKDDCPNYTLLPTTANAMGIAQGTGCLYPPRFQDIADQLSARGYTWKAYQEGIPSPCSTVSSAGNYYRKHNPFVFFESTLDSGQCQKNDVGLNQLSSDLQSDASTPSYSFITPNECDDGHSDCLNPSSSNILQEETDELQQDNGFLQTWVPKIMASPAWKAGGGLIAVIWDESDTDISSCCGEVMNDPDGSTAGGEDSGTSIQIIPGAGGGVTGAVMISPYIKGGTVSTTSYNHYSFLKTLEQTFGLGLLGYANTSGLTPFGTDVWTAWNGTQGPAPPPGPPGGSGSGGTGKGSGTKGSGSSHGGAGGAGGGAGSQPAGNAPARCATHTPRLAPFKQTHAHHTLRLRGTATETRCVASPKLSRVNYVLVAAALKSHKRCRWLGPTGKLSKPVSCAIPYFRKAYNRANWRMGWDTGLRRGSWLAVARAYDANGRHSALRRMNFKER